MCVNVGAALVWDTVPGNGTSEGGTGDWNLTAPNWFNGTATVPWNSGDATFSTAGWAARIAVPSGGVTATTLNINHFGSITADTTDGDLTDDSLVTNGVLQINTGTLNANVDIYAPI